MVIRRNNTSGHLGVFRNLKHQMPKSYGNIFFKYTSFYKMQLREVWRTAWMDHEHTIMDG